MAECLNLPPRRYHNARSIMTPRGRKAYIAFDDVATDRTEKQEVACLIRRLHAQLTAQVCSPAGYERAALRYQAGTHQTTRQRAATSSRRFSRHVPPRFRRRVIPPALYARSVPALVHAPAGIHAAAAVACNRRSVTTAAPSRRRQARRCAPFAYKPCSMKTFSAIARRRYSSPRFSALCHVGNARRGMWQR